MRSCSMTEKFSHRRVASGTGSRGDAAIIVQIKENVNSLSFASRVASGNIQQRQKEFVGWFLWNESFTAVVDITTDFSTTGLRDFSKVTWYIGDEDLEHFV